MARIEVEGYGTYEVEDGTRLVRALEDHGVDMLHRCGGYARCTTCRVTFTAGEPDAMTVAERDKLLERDLLGRVRLSCQIVCDHDMALRPAMPLGSSDFTEPGPTPEATITPEPEWTTRPAP
ncbi:MAG: Ferredoxin [uncultured Thermoleophilia bacterium]|uniref:Ferredoxin n=1 Tax=uncultured Thermoleophilia bacterium TaxID=1497501 RepID=A0A6J4TSU3_9ACTN|nr:MAG: Ferredoxin [uncultured Thermoleophilia bacterium]